MFSVTIESRSVSNESWKALWSLIPLLCPYIPLLPKCERNTEKPQEHDIQNSENPSMILLKMAMFSFGNDACFRELA